jgi:hypothetical protein
VSYLTSGKSRSTLSNGCPVLCAHSSLG